MNAQEMLTVQSIRRAVQLEGLKQGEVDKFAKYLRQIDHLLRADLSGDEYKDFKRKELERKLAEIAALLLVVLTASKTQLVGTLVKVGHSEALFEAKSIANVVDNTLVKSDIKSIKDALLNTPLPVKGGDAGKLIESFIDDFNQTEIDRIIGTIRNMTFQGATNNDIITALRGTKANGYKDGILDIVSRNNDAVARTALAHVVQVARNETFLQNSDIVAKVRWVSILDSHTTDICIALDGTEYPVDSGRRPPAHWRCRSTTVAVLRSKI